jgi:N-acetylglucosamine-6-phosphate deacetylase
MRELRGQIALPDGRLSAARIAFGDRIESIEADSAAPRDLIIPGLIDLQLNGAFGVDVMRADAPALQALAKYLATVGTTGFLATATTAPIDHIIAVHHHIAQAMRAQAGIGAARAAAILGMHLEGPFISSLRLGAHPKLNVSPRGVALDRILGLASLRLLTLAPELDGGLEAIGRMQGRGVIVSLGHSDATFDESVAAIDAGARMFTHVFNAMRPLHQREPGIIGAALKPSAAMAAVIPDGVHVHPEVLGLIHRSRRSGGMVLVSDSILLAGAPTFETGAKPGSSAIRLERGAARLADGTLAGSVISLLEGVRLMVNKSGASVAEASLMAATNPARLLGLDDRGALRKGTRADLLLLDSQLGLKSVFITGREIDAG